MKKEIWKERKISKTVSFSENKYELVPWYLALWLWKQVYLAE